VRSFEFHRPRSIADAVALLRGKESAKLLAGGQSLLPVMKLDLAEPSNLVSLAAVAAAPGSPESARLREIREAGGAGGAGGAGAAAGGGAGAGDRGSVVIGALATHDEVSNSPLVRRLIPGLAALAGGIGDAQVRNRGTIGGSLAHADPAADYPAAVLALGATIETDRRRIAADDFFTGLFATALEPDEIIVAVHFPVPERAAYAKFPHRASKYAVAGVMVARLSEAAGGGVRVGVTGAGSRAFRLPALEAALGDQFTPEAASARTEPDMAPGNLRSDSEASAEYRAHLVQVMARRAIQACL
jgi:carbon-monoxide dehydrogenase medium subunit